MTVVLHVENLKISHVNGDVMNAIISQLSKKYGKEAELKIHQGKLHDYLRMKAGLPRS